MPSFVLGPVKITNVGGDGTVNFGDTFAIAPKSTNKTSSGAGGGNTGDFLMTNTLFSITNTFDPDAVDSNNAANG